VGVGVRAAWQGRNAEIAARAFAFSQATAEEDWRLGKSQAENLITHHSDDK